MKSYLKFILSLFIVSLFFSVKALHPNILINEMMSININTIKDEDGDAEDWVEIYNNGDSAVSLLNWVLTDEYGDNKWRFPDVRIVPGNYLIVFCSGKDRGAGSPTGQNLHTNFKIKSEGEDIYLLNEWGMIADKMGAVELSPDISYGRLTDGSKLYGKFMKPTPGLSNDNSAVLETIDFSHKGGFYLKEFELKINKAFSNDEVRYSIDGSEPTPGSNLYTEPIRIKDNNDKPDIYSQIRTNPEDSPSDWRWKPPQKKSYKANVIRAASFRDGVRTSRIITATYFVDENIFDRYTFPIVSIVSDSLNLFGFEEGIYVPGKIHEENPNPQNYWGSGNYQARGEVWERPAHIEFFENNGFIGLSQDAGIRINGSGGSSLPAKALRLYSRSEYGKNIFDYKFFQEREKSDYKRLILRNSGQDFLWTLFADALMQDLSRNTGIEYMSSRAAVLFINGEYWGIHNLRERYDEHYLKDYCDLEPDKISMYDLDLISHPYKDDHFNEMWQFLDTEDMSDDNNMKIVSEYLDIENIINYYVHKIYFGVFDWPGNNVRLWRPDVPGGKWRWLTYDNDDGMMYPDLNSIAHAIADSSGDWRNPPHSTFIFRKLMGNEKFREDFISMLELRMKTVFSKENILKRISEFKAEYEQEIDEHISRWNYPKSKEYWLECIERMVNFTMVREENVREYIKEYLEGTSITDIGNYDEPLIFPNPNDGNFRIYLGLNADVDFSIQIYDALGNRLYEESGLGNRYIGNYYVNMPGISSGVYLVKIINRGIAETIRMIVTR